MNIVTPFKNKVKEFKEVKGGEVFGYDNLYFMKVVRVTHDGLIFNAADLSDGGLVCFNNTDLVTLYNAELQIKG